MEVSTRRASAGAWTQTAALFLDAYRDLQSRRLFWLTLFLSLLVAVGFGFVGIDSQGITVFGKVLPGAWNSSLIPPAQFYKFLFTSLAIPFWLGFLAAILGLIAGGGIFPDLLTGGSIDLYLSRPIGRLRLFLTKYAFGLLFIAAQVMLFSLASFIIIGLRGQSWEPRIFLAVPLVTLFFSYLFCFCVLIGTLTRSALAAILLTMLFWGGLWAVHNADVVLTTFAVAAEQRLQQQQRAIRFNRELIARNAALPPDRRGNVSQFQFQLNLQTQKLAEYEQTARDLRSWQRLILFVETPLPKTADTVDLMSRWLLNPDSFTAAEEESRQRQEQRRSQRRGATQGADHPPSDFLPRYIEQSETQQQLRRELTGRRIGWIVGTSVAFEAVVLGLAAWIFCRRDY